MRSEALERYFAGTSHTEPPWFYLLVLGAGFFPWQVPLLFGLGRLIRLRRDPGASTALYAAAGLVVGMLAATVIAAVRISRLHMRLAVTEKDLKAQEDLEAERLAAIQQAEKYFCK